MSEISLKKNIAYNYIRTLTNLLFPLITFPYASRILMPGGLGKVNFAQSIVSYFALVAGLGINTYGIRECAKVRNNKSEMSKLSSELFVINVTATIIAYMLFVAAIFVVPKLKNYQKLLCICSASILFTTLGMEWLYCALEEYRYITIRSCLFQCISLILLFLLIKNKDDYIKYAGISVFASAGSNTVNFIYVRKFIDLRLILHKNIAKHLKPIFVMFGMTLAISFYTMLNVIMLGFISGDESVGIYTAAIKLNKVALSVITAANVVFLPRLSFYIGQRNTAQFSALIHKGFSFLLCFSIPIAVGLCILSRPLILLLSGANYLPAIPVMIIMAPIVVILAISNLIGIQLFMPLGKEKLTLCSAIGGAVVSFILNFLLIPSFGAYGAGIATVCTESLITIVQLMLARKYIKLHEIAGDLFQILISVTGMIAVCLFALFMVSNILFQIIISAVIGGIVYFGLLFLMRNKMIYSIVQLTIKKSN